MPSEYSFFWLESRPEPIWLGHGSASLDRDKPLADGEYARRIKTLVKSGATLAPGVVRNAFPARSWLWELELKALAV
ncbi:MAG: hypothetical protein Phyf2KO_23940 [Phycisphaerales bacterium]